MQVAAVHEQIGRAVALSASAEGPGRTDARRCPRRDCPRPAAGRRARRRPSSSPSARSTRMAFGLIWMPAPSALERACLLVDLDPGAGAAGETRQRQPADAGADDGDGWLDGHDGSPREARPGTPYQDQALNCALGVEREISSSSVVHVGRTRRRTAACSDSARRCRAACRGCSRPSAPRPRPCSAPAKVAPDVMPTKMPSLVASSLAAADGLGARDRHDAVDDLHRHGIAGDLRDEVRRPALHRMRLEGGMRRRRRAVRIARLLDAAAQQLRVLRLADDDLRLRASPWRARARRPSACRRCRSRSPSSRAARPRNRR